MLGGVVQRFKQRMERQPLVVRFLLWPIYFVLVALFGVTATVSTLFLPATHSFQRVSTLNPEGYDRSYVQHIIWKRRVRFLAFVITVFAVMAINLFYIAWV